VAFVIGGTQLFEESLPIAAGMVLTEIQRDYAGDTWFPKWDRAQWKESQREAHAAEDGTHFDFVLYERKT
jgi:dihydrofolate reductase